MDTKVREDLEVNGFGASNGGQFNHVTLNGFSTVNSDVDCVEFKSNGFGTVNGNVKSEQFKVNGKAKFKGTIESQSLFIDGTAKIDGNLHAEHVKISGKISVGGRIKSDEINIKGTLTVEEDCEAEIFSAEAQFNIGGLLNADEIKVQIYGTCKVKEIGGQIIIVKHKGSFFDSIIKPLFTAQLETDLIEGDKIDLENTIAKVVRGNQVRIGRNCQIGLVEYSEDFEQDKKAIVNKSVKI
ncbi:polymer-forming cytoskeletal protein [Neobacillus terrae]|uniref:polymer-forming cytoskeletal protein n=1 Tax=Neobacillus terrae TaxID=3034837 RepID=UPI00140CCB64|nr:polymer-forming cytoskeletal protein [Neobacillus terrae]NHM30956.1 cytoplasmic protein [Neobacillus terrae]